jgi:hypothetical protein
VPSSSFTIVRARGLAIEPAPCDPTRQRVLQVVAGRDPGPERPCACEARLGRASREQEFDFERAYRRELTTFGDMVIRLHLQSVEREARILTGEEPYDLRRVNAVKRDQPGA